MKVKNDHRRKFSNLRNWKEEAWKNLAAGLQRSRTCDLRDTGAMLYQLSYEATHWERGHFIEQQQKQIYRDLYGDAMLVPIQMVTNVASGNQQKHLSSSFAFLSNSKTLK